MACTLDAQLLRNRSQCQRNGCNAQWLQYLRNGRNARAIAAILAQWLGKKAFLKKIA